MPAVAFSSSQPTSWPNGTKQKTNNPKIGTVTRNAAVIEGQSAGIEGMPQIWTSVLLPRRPGKVETNVLSGTHGICISRHNNSNGMNNAIKFTRRLLK